MAEARGKSCLRSATRMEAASGGPESEIFEPTACLNARITFLSASPRSAPARKGHACQLPQTAALAFGSGPMVPVEIGQGGTHRDPQRATRG